MPFWAGIGLDTLDQSPASVAALIHGIIFGRVAPQSKQRRAITAPALVVGHPADPIHPFADARHGGRGAADAQFVRPPASWSGEPARTG